MATLGIEQDHSHDRPYPTGRPSKPCTQAGLRGTSAGRRKPSSTRPIRSAAQYLDAGCGTGDIALFLASRGNRVTGIDFLEEPIKRARRKSAERGLTVTFLVKDALTLRDWSERFDSVIDSGLFHVFSDDDRKNYVAGLATVLKAGGRLFLMCFSDEEPGTEGPRRVSKSELQDAFTHGWDIESIQPCRFETRPDLKDFTFSEGGPKAWFWSRRKG